MNVSKCVLEKKISSLLMCSINPVYVVTFFPFVQSSTESGIITSLIIGVLLFLAISILSTIWEVDKLQRADWLPAFVNKSLLVNRNAHSFMYYYEGSPSTMTELKVGTNSVWPTNLNIYYLALKENVCWPLYYMKVHIYIY